MNDQKNGTEFKELRAKEEQTRSSPPAASRKMF